MAASAGRETKPASRRYTFEPLTAERWKDIEALFGPKGACAGCWCMWWRLRRAEWTKGRGAGNRRALKRIVEGGEAPGIIAYFRGRPVGWCAIAPREKYAALERSRILRPVDDRPVWSVPCFYISRDHRRAGLTSKLLEAAVAHARRRGARIVEGYPVDPRAGRLADLFAFTGLASAFRKAGFTEVARRSVTRPIMRRRTRARPHGGS